MEELDYSFRMGHDNIRKGEYNFSYTTIITKYTMGKFRKLSIQNQ